MKLGIFSKVFIDYSVEDAFKKIASYGLHHVQFNFSNVGLNSLPKSVGNDIISTIKKVSDDYGIEIPIVSGTFNTLELNDTKRQDNMKRFDEVCRVASILNIPFVSISTGSFNQDDFWSSHPDNHSENAWKMLYQSLDVMLQSAMRYDIVIVVEPEQANVVSSVEDTIRLMKHYDSKHLRVLFDAANIVTYEDRNTLEEKINDSLKKLKEYIVIAHCKDCKFIEGRIEFASVGRGDLPLREYINSLSEFYHGPIIMHGLSEEDVEFALNYLENGR
ncbi:sugar phosphate isomerase/epimerase [Erysipelothrix sp. HDW6A]|uniref:sugar phosphate isomerase/epimerase family protein n=1 Tax=Erysipelothrix sp. HDW6A TaxID=2714928 RepID=UPI00140BF2F9|nr:sugar phosphate isomerase/epimerase [Erysipelothrix sp. HDW6A]QIK58148.1 sugar phosphate isomerase/epimerase [Erysipelothrix sp. HDW6A]